MRRHSLRIDGVDGGVFVGVVVVVDDELLEDEIWWRGSGMADEPEREKLDVAALEWSSSSFCVSSIILRAR
jgi:hypothetical protein